MEDVSNREVEYAWVAGIIEGEGSFAFSKIPTRADSYRVMIQISMTDRDVLEDVQRILGVGNLNGPYQYDGRKPLYTWSVQNQKGCFDTLIRIGPFLKGRRRKQVSEMFEFLEGRLT